MFILSDTLATGQSNLARHLSLRRIPVRFLSTQLFCRRLPGSFVTPAVLGFYTVGRIFSSSSDFGLCTSFLLGTRLVYRPVPFSSVRPIPVPYICDLLDLFRFLVALSKSAYSKIPAIYSVRFLAKSVSNQSPNRRSRSLSFSFLIEWKPHFSCTYTFAGNTVIGPSNNSQKCEISFPPMSHSSIPISIATDLRAVLSSDGESGSKDLSCFWIHFPLPLYLNLHFAVAGKLRKGIRPKSSLNSRTSLNTECRRSMGSGKKYRHGSYSTFGL